MRRATSEGTRRGFRSDIPWWRGLNRLSRNKRLGTERKNRSRFLSLDPVTDVPATLGSVQNAPFDEPYQVRGDGAKRDLFRKRGFEGLLRVGSSKFSLLKPGYYCAGKSVELSGRDAKRRGGPPRGASHHLHKVE